MHPDDEKMIPHSQWALPTARDHLEMMRTLEDVRGLPEVGSAAPAKAPRAPTVEDEERSHASRQELLSKARRPFPPRRPWGS